MKCNQIQNGILLGSGLYAILCSSVCNGKLLRDCRQHSAFAGNILGDDTAAPTMAFSPITIFERIVDPEPMEAPFLTTVAQQPHPARSAVPPSGVYRTRVAVVKKCDTMADEYAVRDICRLPQINL